METTILFRISGLGFRLRGGGLVSRLIGARGDLKWVIIGVISVLSKFCLWANQIGGMYY